MDEAASRKEGLVLVAMALAMIMDGIDGSIVNVALPSIAMDFGTDVGVASWVAIIYYMMMAGLMLPFGRVADLGHLKRIFIAGFALFTASSLLCGLSASFTMLCVSRVIQGVGAAMLGAVAPMMCVKFVSPSRLGFALGVLTMASASGLAAGPALGGFITDLLSWHWIFFINVPIGIAAVLFGLHAIPRDRPVPGAHLDSMGASLFFVSVVSGVFALESVSDPERMPAAIASASLSISLFAGFVAVELREEKPLLNVRMFKNLKLDSVILSYMMINLVYFGITYLLPFYLSIELHMDPAASGLVLLIPSAITLAMCIPIGRLCDMHGRRPFALAASLMLVVSNAVFAMAGPEMGLLPILIGNISLGLVWGLCGASSSSRIVDNTPPEDKGMGSTLMNFVVYVSGTIGTAMFAVLHTAGSGSLGTPIDQLDPSVFMDGFTFATLCSVALSVISVIAAYVVKEKDSTKNGIGASKPPST